jgi:hypothetical protein
MMGLSASVRSLQRLLLLLLILPLLLLLTSNGKDFIPEKTWQGSKEGYYFWHCRTRHRIHFITQALNAAVTSNSSSPHANRNAHESRSLTATKRESSSRSTIFQQAEEEASKTKIVDLNRRSLDRQPLLSPAVEKNELQRAEHGTT